jgi:hypothetical protein
MGTVACNRMLPCFNLSLAWLFRGLLFLAVALPGPIAFAQEVKILELPDSTPKIPLFGRNRLHFVSTNVGFGTCFGPDDDRAPARYGFSNTAWLSLQYKYRINGLLAWGAETRYSAQWFGFRQTDEKVFPTAAKWKRERLFFHKIEAGGYLRINFDPRRGDIIGRYLDLGALVTLPVGLTHFTENKGPEGTIVNTRTRRLPYRQPIWGVAVARLGWGNLALEAQWRWTQALKAYQGETYELPAFSLGLAIGIY